MPQAQESRIESLKFGVARDIKPDRFSTLPEHTGDLMATSRMDSRSASARSSGGDFGLMLPLSVEM
jgi:hypothetical protein